MAKSPPVTEGIFFCLRIGWNEKNRWGVLIRPLPADASDSPCPKRKQEKQRGNQRGLLRDGNVRHLSSQKFDDASLAVCAAVCGRSRTGRGRTGGGDYFPSVEPRIVGASLRTGREPRRYRQNGQPDNLLVRVLHSLLRFPELSGITIIRRPPINQRFGRPP